MESDIDKVFVSFPSSSEEDRQGREEWFTGDIAEWAKIRARRFGDVIVAKHMYIEFVYHERHSAAWLEHTGNDPDTGKRYCLHHLACDCIRFSSTSVIEDGTAIDCPVFQNALTERAHKLDEEYRIHETLQALEGTEDRRNEKPEIYHDMVLTIMEETLHLDRSRPYSWMGNVVNGQHQVNLMSEMLHVPIESVQMYADILQLNDKIDRDGEFIRLKEAA